MSREMGISIGSLTKLNESIIPETHCIIIVNKSNNPNTDIDLWNFTRRFTKKFNNRFINRNSLILNQDLWWNTKTLQVFVFLNNKYSFEGI